MSFRKITVAGGGVLGCQIAMQSAYKGFDVTIWHRSYSSIGRSQPKLDRLHAIYIKELKSLRYKIGALSAEYPRGLAEDFVSLTPEKVNEMVHRAERAYKNIHMAVDLNEAMEDADLVIEAIAENEEQKIGFYRRISDVLPPKAILVTTSSTMLPRTFAEYTGRPEKFLAMNFAGEIWAKNIAEIMGHPGTDQKAYDQVAAFAADIGMVPLCLKKEHPGYILNSLLIPFLEAAKKLKEEEVADPETIDRTWKLATGAPEGPFRIMDEAGLRSE